MRRWLHWVRRGLGSGCGLGCLGGEQSWTAESAQAEQSARQDSFHDGRNLQEVNLRNEVALAVGIVHWNRLPGPMGTLLRFAEITPYVLD